MYFLYSVLTAAATVLLAPYFLGRSLRHRHKQYLQNLPERLGLRFPADLKDEGGNGSCSIWIHTVSVGEALAAVPLARALKQKFGERGLIISTTTATGQAVARERMTFADAI